MLDHAELPPFGAAFIGAAPQERMSLSRFSLPALLAKMDDAWKMDSPSSGSLSPVQVDATPVVTCERMSLSFIVHPAADLLGANHEHLRYLDSVAVSAVCSKKNCRRTARTYAFGCFCELHKPSRLCKIPDCTKCAKTGGYCIAHGGGRRCLAVACIKSAKEGGYCIAHGGGKRCKMGGCTKSALAGGLCSAHGGGKRCKAEFCAKTALKGGLCIAHGGGRRCEVAGCGKSAVGGHVCVSHGGGRRCRESGCSKGAVRHGLCIRHGARHPY